MALIYNDNARTGPINISIRDMDGTKAYLRHYGSKLELLFYAANGTRQEKWQAEKELIICERKLLFWEKHPNFVSKDARKGVEKLNKDWNGGRA